MNIIRELAKWERVIKSTKPEDPYHKLAVEYACTLQYLCLLATCEAKLRAEHVQCLLGVPECDREDDPIVKAYNG